MRIPYKIGAVSMYTNHAFAFNTYYCPQYVTGSRGTIAIDIINYIKRKQNDYKEWQTFYYTLEKYF